MMFFLLKRIVLVFLLGAISLSVLAETFRLKDIQIEGLERIEAGTVFTYLPIKVGDQLDESQTAKVIRELFKTGLFKDIQLRREGNVLVIVVEERPAIASISFDGNKILDDDQLTEVLVGVGIATGHVFNRSVLERLETELIHQYFAFGKYSVNIDTQITELQRNRVDIAIRIMEGDVAKIKHVKIVGNKNFEEEDLIEDFESGLKSWYQFWGTRDRYAKPKLEGDLEILRGHYLNHGYLKFNIESAQVSISPDKKDIFITININEGDQYTLDKVELAGNFILPESELWPLITVTSGEIFSRAKIFQSTQAIKNRFADDGYAFPDISTVPEVDEENKKVSIKIFIDPGKRIYVRRVNFTGHQATRDEVYRRELRQMEGGWYSQGNIETSRSRLNKLPYVQSVEISTKPIPNVDDFVDLQIDIKERLAGSFNIGAGFSDSQGLVASTSVSQENFLGSGKTVAFSVNTSKVNTIYALKYTNPYYTIDGVSRGFGFNFVSTEADEADISDFDTDQFGLSLNYGIPLTEVDRISAYFQLKRTVVSTTTNTPTEVLKFIDENDDRYLNLSMTSSLSHDTRNRNLFPSSGNRQLAMLEFTAPGSDLEFYKLSYLNSFYFPLSKAFTLLLGGELGYGDQYASTTDLPFYEKFRAGGYASVRGYENNSLGPRDSLNEPYGGNFLTTARAELSFRGVSLPFVGKDSSRLSVFVDAGNVFEEVSDFDSSEIRGSFGVGVKLITGFGGISAAIAAPFNDEPGDETEGFQFNLGTSF